ncbi:MAG: DUF192 domain-containing protein, partial [Betaproteobacteria bacterium]|nr:DUF192 domain-containing protein [Betaproteobacteria bacterium]
QVGVNQPQPKLPTMVLHAGGHKIVAEVAATVQTREVGMMLRTKMGKDEGMLFVFNELGYHAMWMRNTLIPLSVAFADQKGVILSIHEMAPQTEDNHQAAGPARYALEMNGGWFTANKVKVGDTVGGLEKAPKPQ